MTSAPTSTPATRNTPTGPTPEVTGRLAAAWHLPVLLVGITMLALGVWLAMPEPPVNRFDDKLAATAKYLQAGQLDSARAALDEMRPVIGEAGIEQQARFNLYTADVMYLEQLDSEVFSEEIHRRILGLYGRAWEITRFDAQHLRRWLSTFVALGEIETALNRLALFDGADARHRHPIVRLMIERELGQPQVDHVALTSLLTRYQSELRHESDAARQIEGSRWAVAHMAQVLMDTGAPAQALDYLQPRIMVFRNQGAGDQIQPLLVKLARAYQMIDEFRQARSWYAYAQERIDPGDPLNAEILVGLARITLAESEDIRGALDLFSQAERNFPASPLYFEALVGRADCEARLGSHFEAREHLGQAVGRIVNARVRHPAQVDRVTEVVQSHFGRAFDVEAYERALDYLTLLKPLHPVTLPGDLVLALARTHEQLALRLSAQAEQDLHASEPRLTGPARQVIHQQAASHFAQAADFYLTHANGAARLDDHAHGDSLWNAARSFDRAQLPGKAIDAYADFVRTRPSDPRKLAAANHLGLAYMADSQYQVARDLFVSLVEEHPQSPDVYDALVPLARAHIALEEYDAAERVLLHVVEDHPAITPQAPQFREALIELGRLYYRRGAFELAIERLDQAVDRYAVDAFGAGLVYRLADAYRQSALDIMQTLEEPMPQSRRRELRDLRDHRLQLGQEHFDRAIELYASRHADTLDPLDRVFHRNAYFYRADCAYDLKAWPRAITLYDTAAQRFENDPASLGALVQIVNAYAEMGEIQKARVANERARWQLNRIPDAAFEDPSLPMSRRHWEDWLRWSSDMDLFDQPQANAAPG